MIKSKHLSSKIQKTDNKLNASIQVRFFLQKNYKIVTNYTKKLAFYTNVLMDPKTIMHDINSLLLNLIKLSTAEQPNLQLNNESIQFKLYKFTYNMRILISFSFCFNFFNTVNSPMMISFLLSVIARLFFIYFTLVKAVKTFRFVNIFIWLP